MYAIFKDGFFYNKTDENGNAIFSAPLPLKGQFYAYTSKHAAEDVARITGGEVVSVPNDLIMIGDCTAIGQPNSFECKTK